MGLQRSPDMKEILHPDHRFTQERAQFIAKCATTRTYAENIIAHLRAAFMLAAFDLLDLGLQQAMDTINAM